MTAEEFKKSCIELRQQDFTLGEIVKALGRPKTSVFFHIQHLPLSQERKREIRDWHTEHINQFNRLRKGRSKRPFREFSQWNEQNVALVAHLLFDGELRPASCIYNNRNRALIDRVKNTMMSVYDYKPSECSQNGVIRISYHNVALAIYLGEKSRRLINEIDILPRELKRVFLRAFYDDEGCMYFSGKKRAVRGYQHDDRILEIVQRLLKGFQINSTISRFYEVSISRRENLECFAKEINFSPGVRINGERSNSIWRRPLEKREILRRALASYQQ